MGSEYTQIQKPMLFNKFVEFYDNALYYGGTTQPKNLMTKESSEELIAEDKAKGESKGNQTSQSHPRDFQTTREDGGARTELGKTRGAGDERAGTEG